MRNLGSFLRSQANRSSRCLFPSRLDRTAEPPSLAHAMYSGMKETVCCRKVPLTQSTRATAAALLGLSESLTCARRCAPPGETSRGRGNMSLSAQKAPAVRLSERTSFGRQDPAVTEYMCSCSCTKAKPPSTQTAPDRAEGTSLRAAHL